MSAGGGAGLLELVARGKKDTFFTGDPKISFFHSIYRRASPWLRETRYLLPRNEGDFESYIDFTIDPVADIVKDIHLLIQLPTWLPPSIAAINGTSVIRDLSGNSYGYTNHIGYYCIQKIQLFQNQLMFYEDFGEAMWLRAQSKYTNGKITVINSLTGGHDGSLLEIQRNATPGQLEVKLNIPFDSLPKDFGLPISAISPFSLKIRIYINKFSHIMESSSGVLAPNVFERTMTVQSTLGGTPTNFVTKKKSELGRPNFQLRVQYVYVDSVCQKLLRETTWKVPFLRCIANQFTLEDNIWKIGVPPTLRKLLEVYGSIQRLRILFQSEASVRAGQAWKYTPSSGTNWFTSLTFFIHGQDRLGLWESDVFEKVTSYAHDVGKSVSGVYLLDTGAEDLDIPAGTLNLTQAEKPELQILLIDLANDSRTGDKKTFMRVYADIWDLLELSGQWIKLSYS